MTRLSRAEFEHLAPAEPGKVRVNHDSGHCSGESLSLIIERKDDDSISAHCFRCGARGWIAPAGYYRQPRMGQVSGHHELVEHDGYMLPPDVSSNRAEWPVEPVQWLGKAGLLDTTRKPLWSQERATLYLPVEQEGISAYGPKLTGYVLRRFDPKSYLTLTSDKAAFWGLYRGEEGHSTVVLTEDVLSAWRVAELTDSISIMGTELKPQILSFLLTSGHRRAIIYLDADNPTVKAKARSIAQALSFLPEVHVLETGRDPKYEPKERLRELLGLTQP